MIERRRLDDQFIAGGRGNRPWNGAARTQRLLRQSRLHRDNHIVRHLPHKNAAITAGRYQMLAVICELQSGNQFAVAVHARHALGRIVVVHAQRFIRARCGNVDAAQVQAQLDQAALVRMRALERFCVLGILRAINANVAILARGQNVLAIAVDLHVVQRVLARAIVAAQQLIILERAENDRFVCATRHHLERQSGADELHRSYTTRMVVQRLQNLIVLVDIEHVDKTIATSAGQQPSLDLVIRVLEAQHFRVVRLDGGEQFQRAHIVDANVAAAIARRQMMPFRADLHAAHPIAAVIARRLLHIQYGIVHVLNMRKLIVDVEHLQQLLAVDIFAVDFVVLVAVQSPHANRVVRRARQKAIGRQIVHQIVLQCVIWHSFNAPNARRMVQKRMALADPSNVPCVPHIQTVIVVNATELHTCLVEHHGNGVGIFGGRRHIGDVIDVHALRHVHAQVVGARQCGHIFEILRAEHAHNRFGTSDQNVFAAYAQTIGGQCAARYPFVQHPAAVELHQMAVACDGIGAFGEGATATGHRTKVIVAQLTQNGTASHQRYGLLVLAATLQIPVFDVAIAHRHEVIAIFAEADGYDFGTDFVRGNFQVLLPIEHIDDHVMLAADRHQVFAGRRKCNATDGVFVAEEFGHYGAAGRVATDAAWHIVIAIAGCAVQFPHFYRGILAAFTGRNVSV